jgi:hypothetical protein
MSNRIEGKAGYPTRRESYQWRKNPVVIDAWQWDGDWDRLNAWLDLLGAGSENDADSDGPMWENGDGSLTIPTLEGEHRCDLNDFIIRGVKGEFYPCKPDIFALTYEPSTTPGDGRTTRSGLRAPSGGDNA